MEVEEEEGLEGWDRGWVEGEDWAFSEILMSFLLWYLPAASLDRGMKTVCLHEAGLTLPTRLDGVLEVSSIHLICQAMIQLRETLFRRPRRSRLELSLFRRGSCCLGDFRCWCHVGRYRDDIFGYLAMK